ncbi:MAG: hypothetical protein ACLUGF_05650 [Clostridium sp.]
MMRNSRLMTDELRCRTYGTDGCNHKDGKEFCENNAPFMYLAFLALTPVKVKDYR